MPLDRFLIVRLGALGDIIHALPVAAALREAFPAARIDWLVSERHRAILDYVPVIDRCVVLERPRGARASSGATATSWRAVAQAIAELRQADYDVAFDLQGLLKSSILARSSGARRVVGFPVRHLRERWAHLFYTETIEPPTGVHVVDKNLALLAAVGLRDLPKRFPLGVGAGGAGGTGGAGLPRRSAEREGRTSDVAPSTPDTGHRTPDDAFALLNPGAGWPNKRWPPEWFGVIADRLRANHGLASVVLWGPGEEALARTVVESSRGAARLAPPTGIGDMIVLARAASLLVSGDTGPLHIAAAVGTPVVGIYGPTNPARNGPWNPADLCVSRFDACHCHHRRRCRLPVCCLLDIGVEEVCAAIDRRLAADPSRHA
jgi:lipopolysaccharide heptosyltransferase I